MFPLVGSVTLTGQAQIWFFNPSALELNKISRHEETQTFHVCFCPMHVRPGECHERLLFPTHKILRDTRGCIESWVSSFSESASPFTRTRDVDLFACSSVYFFRYVVFFLLLFFFPVAEQTVVGYRLLSASTPSHTTGSICVCASSPSDSFELWAEVCLSGPKHGNKHKKAGKPNAP